MNPSEPVPWPEATPDPQPSGPSETAKHLPSIKVIGLGGAGCNAVAHMACEWFVGVEFVALNTDAQALAAIQAERKHLLGNTVTRGLGAGGDPSLGRQAAESDEALFRELCRGAEIVFIMAGLGGGTGTGAAPVLARVARESGALVLGIVTLPFDCEGARRQRQAREGLDELKREADGVICLPNQKVVQLISEHASVVETFRFTNELLNQGVRSIWRMVTQTGLINIDFADICAVLRGRHGESALATAEAQGENRSVEVVDRLLVNPLLDGGQALTEADAVLVSIAGGPDLTMGEIHRVMEQINRQCDNAHIIMGAVIDDLFAGHLAVTVMASRRGSEIQLAGPADAPMMEKPDGGRAAQPMDETREFDTHFLSRSGGERPASRFVPPAPTLPDERKEALFAERQGGGKVGRKRAPKMQQAQLPLEIISRGRFEKSEPTIHEGEDLDVPTYIRRGVVLN